MDTLIFRQDGKKWILPRTVPVKDALFDINGDYVTHKTIFYKVLGYRPIKKGEWFLSGAVVEAYMAKSDSDSPVLVIQPICVAKQVHTYIEGTPVKNLSNI